MWIWLSGYLHSPLQASLALALAGICLGFFATRRGLSFYILFEASLIPTLAIVLLFGYQPEKLSAGGYLLLYLAVRSLPLLMLLINRAPYFSLWSDGTLTTGAAALALVTAFLVKRPMYGVHLWLPKAHVEAPVCGSIALAGILLKLGSFGLFVVLPVCAGPVVTFLLLLSA